MKEPINVNGKRLNKLEEIIKLLQKLNEDHYDETEREQEGYPICIELKSDGSGFIGSRFDFFYRFNSTQQLENFLKAKRREQLQMSKENN